LDQVDPSDPVIERDGERLQLVKQEHAEQAMAYFTENAERWDDIRALHVPDAIVERTLLDMIGDMPFQRMLDLGTGTGRMLEMFAPLFSDGIGVDSSHAMLNIARTNLDEAGLSQAQVRHGDILNPGLDRGRFDLISLHQVLHYLDQPGVALKTAARMLNAGGRLLIVDFAPHNAEFLRDTHAHRRLGFAKAQMQDWIEGAGLLVADVKDLVPETTTDANLTVSIWLAKNPVIEIAGAGLASAERVEV
jgi:ArsR family transcriptional regulator